MSAQRPYRSATADHQASKPASRQAITPLALVCFLSLCVLCGCLVCSLCALSVCVRACWLAVALRRGRWANKAATVAPSSPQGGLHMCRWWVDPNLGKRPALPHHRGRSGAKTKAEGGAGAQALAPPVPAGNVVATAGTGSYSKHLSATGPFHKRASRRAAHTVHCILRAAHSGGRPLLEISIFQGLLRTLVDIFRHRDSNPGRSGESRVS